jgi:hypothetical protein
LKLLKKNRVFVPGIALYLYVKTRGHEWSGLLALVPTLLSNIKLDEKSIGEIKTLAYLVAASDLKMKCLQH